MYRSPTQYPSFEAMKVIRPEPVVYCHCDGTHEGIFCGELIPSYTGV